jgi:hypothetical protein
VSTLSGSLVTASGPLAQGAPLHFFDLGGAFIGSATVTAAAYTMALADGTYHAYVEPASPTNLMYPAQWIGGDSQATAEHIVVAGDTVRDLYVRYVGEPLPAPPDGAIEWVSADEIRAQVGNLPPDPGDAWAMACADAVNAGIDRRLEGVEVLAREDLPEVLWSARTAGAEAYKRREAVYGLTGYVDLQGAAIRVARDYLEAIGPQLARYATRGIA